MLVDINFKQEMIDECDKRLKEICKPEDYDNLLIKEVNDFCNRLKKGIYETGLNFHMDIDLFSTDKIKEKFNSFLCIRYIDGKVDWDYLKECEKKGIETKSNYGICDNYQQVIDFYPELNDKNRKFVISLCKISKKNQPKNGGWRWHKWGDYIGIQNPQCEYIYYEPKIEEVYVYHIFEME
jgi:hypothetical protein